MSELDEKFGSDVGSESWLSDNEVIAKLPSEKLALMRQRLALQIYAIDAELGRRRFDDFRRRKARTTTLTEADLQEPRERGPRASRAKRGSSAPKRESDPVKKLLAQLPKEKIIALARLAELRKK